MNRDLFPTIVGRKEYMVIDGLRRYKPKTASEEIELIEARAEELPGLLDKMEVGEHWSKNFPVNGQATRNMEGYIERIRMTGLDIGKGDCQYEFKMPLPAKSAIERQLVIFRRK